MSTITPLTTPAPTRADPANFRTRADTLVDELPTMVTEINVVVGELNSLAADVASDASTSAASALAASASASAAADSEAAAGNSETAAAGSAASASVSASAASTSASNAATSETNAAASEATAVAAAEASGLAALYDTKADATAALGSLSEGDLIEVIADESVSGSPRTRYRVESAALVLKINLDLLRTDAASSTEGKGADLLPTTIKRLANVTAARALTTATTVSVIFIGGTDGGLFHRDSSDTTSAEDGGSYCGTIIRSADYATRGVWKRVFDGVVTPDMFGSVGDDSDETTPLTNALAAAAGRTLRLATGKTYRTTTALTPSANTTILLNGSTIKFVVTGNTKCLDLRSGCTVLNGSVELAGSSYSGSGDSGCPILIGDYGVGTGYNKVHVEGIEISSNKAGGNGIMVTGDSHNVVIKNVKFPTTANISRPVLVHWGGANTPSAGTTHPYNIKIESIELGDLTYNSADTAAVLISGAYNVTVDGVDAPSIPNGNCIYVYPGDYGAQYAGSVANSILRGIKIKSVQSRGALVGLYATSKNISGTVATIPAEVIVDGGCTFVGSDNTNASCYGLHIVNMDGLKVRDSVIQANNYNVHLNGVCANIDINTNTIKASYARAINLNTGVSNLYTNISIEKNLFDTNNTQGSAGRRDIQADYCRGLKVRGNRFVSPNMAAALRCENTTQDVLIDGNHVESLAGGGVGFSLGSGTDYSINAHGGNNTVASGLTYQGGAPIFSRKPNNTREFYATAAPTSGAWIVGDRAINSAPSVGQPKAWTCTAAGTPGTWTSEGNL